MTKRNVQQGFSFRARAQIYKDNPRMWEIFLAELDDALSKIAQDTSVISTVLDADGTALRMYKTINTDGTAIVADTNADTAGVLGGTGVTTSGSGDNITVTIGQDVATSATPEFAGLTLKGDVILDSAADRSFHPDTDDGSDDRRALFGGGGALNTTRGAYIIASGNEDGTTPGDLFLMAGSTGDVTIGGAVIFNDAITGVTAITLAAGTNITEFSTDDTLGGDSDNALPTEQAVKAYVDGQVAAVDSESFHPFLSGGW